MQKLMNLICVGNKKSIGLVVFLSTFFGLVACQAGPEVLSAPVMVVEIPRYERPGPIRVHFLPCNQVRITAAATSPGYPGYPYNYPMVMERVAECPKK